MTIFSIYYLICIGYTIPQLNKLNKIDLESHLKEFIKLHNLPQNVNVSNLIKIATYSVAFGMIIISPIRVPYMIIKYLFK